MTIGDINLDAIMGALIVFFSVGSIVVYSICTAISKNWRRLLFVAAVLSCTGLVFGYVSVIFSFFTPEILTFIIRPAFLVLVALIFRFGVEELRKLQTMRRAHKQ